MPYLGEISALVTAFLWSGTSLMFTSATMRVGTIQVNITRLLLAFIYLSLVIFVAGIPIAMTRSQIFNLVVSGLIGLVFGDTFLFRAFKLNGARISMLIMSLVPAISALLAWMTLGESPELRTIAGMSVTIAGIAMVVLDRTRMPSLHGHATFAGLVYAFLGALGQAVGLIFAKAAFNEGYIHGFTATAVRILASIVVLLPAGMLARKYANPFRVFRSDRKALFLTLGGSVCGPFLGITFSLVAIANTQIGIASTIMATPPIIMLPMLWLFYKEKLSWRAIAGALVAVAGVGVLFLK
jgi:drug/metabolite transporter (DMT)-like permease